MEILGVLQKVTSEMVADLKKEYPQYTSVMELEDLKQEICCRALTHNVSVMTPEDYIIFYRDVFDDVLGHLQAEHARLQRRDRIMAYAKIICSVHVESAELTVFNMIEE